MTCSKESLKELRNFLMIMTPFSKNSCLIGCFDGFLYNNIEKGNLLKHSNALEGNWRQKMGIHVRHAQKYIVHFH